MLIYILSILVLFLSLICLFLIYKFIIQPKKNSKIIINKDRKIISYDKEIQKIFGWKDNEMIGDEIFIQNISDLTFEEKMSMKSSQIKSNFISNLSHELRTPMNGIISMTHLTLQTDLTSRQKHYLQTIEKSSTSLLKVINNILDFSNIRSGELKINKINFNFYQLLDTIKIENLDKNITFELFYDKDISQYLHGDSLRIEQILGFFLDNAVKFTKDG
ncbi:MAG: histidine kinase dimerization/phospho-acceptor domain-containing protein, partial [Campylobacterota bacterium]|nr:histidine kinase dimerization/phospho-acceptor domain-containing protein [Campylobacterota bacterium]